MVTPRGFALAPAGPGEVRARLLVEIKAPWNAFAGDSLRGDNPNGTLDVVWFENAAEAPAPWTSARGARGSPRTCTPTACSLGLRGPPRAPTYVRA